MSRAVQATIVPVSWIGPERSKNATPLTQDQLEAHVLRLSGKDPRSEGVFAKHAAKPTEDDKKEVQEYVDGLVEQLNGTFAELGKQHGLLEDMRTNLTNVRVHCIQMFMSVCEMNGASHGWAARQHTWLSTFEIAKRKLSTHSDAKIWNECSSKKAVIERDRPRCDAEGAANGVPWSPISDPAKKESRKRRRG